MKKLEFIGIGLLLIVSFVLRLHRFNGPIADWHSWRQSDTSAVSRNFVEHGFDLLHPKFEDLSNVASGFDNPHGYRFVEFPIYNFWQAYLYKVFGHFTLVEWGRLVTIISSLFATVFLYLIVRKHSDRLTAFFAALFFVLLPFDIYYQRTILPDPSMVTATLGAIYFFDVWLDNGNIILYILSLIAMASALLLKPYAVFFTLPILYLVFTHFGLKAFKKPSLWIFLILSILPLVFWRIWMLQYPSGIPVSAWLFNAGNIRFKGAFFYWLFANRIGELILGYWGIGLLVLGIVRKIELKKYLFFLSFLVSSLFYMTVMARGNVQHDYYQILIVPSLCIFLALGAQSLIRPSRDLLKIPSYIMLLVCVLFMLSFSWYFVRSYFNINNPSIIIAGNAINNLIPKNAKIIANYNGDTSFLYATQRNGWASFEKPLPEMIKMGASYLALVNPTSQDLALGKQYKIVASTSAYVLFNLRQSP